MTAAELASLRKRLGMSQKEMAQALNVSTITIVRWEKPEGRGIPPETARLLECLAGLLDKVSDAEPQITPDEIREALRATGILGVVTTGAMSGTIPQNQLMRLTAMPAFAWLGGVLGLTGAVALPFFVKLYAGLRKKPENR